MHRNGRKKTLIGVRVLNSAECTRTPECFVTTSALETARDQHHRLVHGRIEGCHDPQGIVQGTVAEEILTELGPEKHLLGIQ